VVLVVVAAAIGAWLLFSIRAVDLQARAEKTLVRAQGGHASRAEVARGLDDLRRAGRHSPDLTPLLDRGYLLYAAGHRQRAREVALSAAAKEPQNAQAYTLLFLTAPDRATRREASRRLASLNYWLAVALRRRY
jgi:hypothetical protein